MRSGRRTYQIAYLVNVYPSPSHSFIRREIAALEDLGWSVSRFSVRRSDSPLVDPADQAELSRTEVILDAGTIALLLAVLGCLLRSPGRFLRAARMALRLGRISDRGVFRHAIYLAEAAWLRNRLLGQGITHLHAHFGTNSATVALLCRLLGGLKYSFTVHGPEEFDKATILGLDQKIAHAAFVVAISQFGRSQLYRWCDYADWPKIQVVHCGLDQAFFTAEPTPVPDNRRLVCVGRLCEQKGQLLLVEAGKQLGDAGHQIELVLVGDGPMRSEIESRISDCRLQSHIRITGWASGEVVMREIQESRVFVLPSFAEGLPVVIMEAMALGRPVISTYVAGIPELVRPSENGWLVPAGNVDTLAHAIREALDAPVDCLNEMGRAGRKAVLMSHEIRKEASKLASLFQASLEDRK
jgi:colanic acid/amylovoran biosynthesis glycosyltransferase